MGYTYILQLLWGNGWTHKAGMGPTNSRDSVMGCWKACWATELPYPSSFLSHEQWLFPYQALYSPNLNLHSIHGWESPLITPRSVPTWVSRVDNSYLPTVIWTGFKGSKYWTLRRNPHSRSPFYICWNSSWFGFLWPWPKPSLATVKFHTEWYLSLFSHSYAAPQALWEALCIGVSV